MTEKEVIERLNRYKTIKVLYGNTFAMHLEQLEQLKNDIDTVLNLLEKKDKESHFIQSELDIANAKIIKLNKIIDLMAYDIATNDSNLCQYIDETIRCKKYAGENKLTCDECIKQYFERKVENEN